MNCDVPPVPISEEVERVNSQLRMISKRYEGVEYFDANRYLCPDRICPVFDDSGEPIYFDTDHLTIKASWLLGSEIVRKEGVPRSFAAIANPLN